MAIYRGDGGAGDANTNISINQVTAKALEASASATAAAASATEAASSAENAFNENQEAHDQAAAASLSALDASSSATSASGSATLAGSFAAEASNYKDLAAFSEATATYAASQASNSATAAETAQTAAEAAQTAAEAAQTATENLFTQFGDQYLGSFSTNPTLDNSGNALTTGDVYWNSTDSVLKFYTGSAWVAPEDVATTAATNAAASASFAATSETNASSSASSASSSATAAASSASEAASYAASINPADIVHISGTETVTGVKTFSSDPVLSGGTTNGVAYLDGSKVLTSGSALTFDGATLGVNAILDASGGSTATVNGYTPTASNMAGRNRIINGNFDIWQRGTSAVTGNNLYSADRWQQLITSSSMSTTQSQFTLGQTDVPNNPKYYLTSVVTTASTSSSLAILSHKVEYVSTLAGQTVTLSFYAKADSNKSIGVEIGQYFGTGGSPSTQATGTGNVVNLTPSWQKHTITYTVPSVSGKTLGTNGNDCLYVFFWLEGGSDYNARTGSIGNQNITFNISQVQLEEGTVATPFEHRQYGQELALCQRYYYKYDFGTYGNFGVTGVADSNTAYGSYFMPVQMRTQPTSLETTGTASDYRLWYGGGNVACNAVPTFYASSVNSVTVRFPTAGLTVGNAYIHRSNASNVYLSFSAEL